MRPIYSTIVLALAVTGCASLQTIPEKPCAPVSVSKDFEGGAYDSAVTGCGTVTLSITPEGMPINPSPWYGFDVTTPMAQDVAVTLDYGTYRHRYTPMLTPPGGEPVRVEQEPVITGERNTATFTFALAAGTTRIAAGPLMTSSKEKAWIAGVISGGALTVTANGYSVEGRDIPVLETAPTDKVVVILGRQHPPEVPGTIGVHAFVERLMADDELATSFRQEFSLLIVPMVNPDGVDKGYWRWGLSGVDINRDWGPFITPEARFIKGQMERVAADGRDVTLGLDFHATNRDVLYTQPDGAPGAHPDYGRHWHEAINALLDDAPIDRNGAHNPDLPTFKGWVHDAYQVPGITVEFGDNTPPERIERISVIAAEEMMSLLLNESR